ncbi:MAG: hypothetical protein H0V96_09775 [Acidimicrobiia bacterium]|nr:hypothetical protein [Acidimicrobiia bacterium]
MRNPPEHMGRRTAVLAVLVLAAGLLVVVPATAQTNERRATEEHCVAVAVDQAADGELVVSEPQCFATKAEAADAVAALTTAAPSDSANAGSPGLQVPLSTMTLGIHYDGTGGTGSSISITGSGCTGGYWNASAYWTNRISSTWNGCYQVKHYDFAGKVGSSYSTYTVGQIDSLSWFSNDTGSVSYHS